MEQHTFKVNGWLRRVFYWGIVGWIATSILILYRQHALYERWNRFVVVFDDGTWTPNELRWIVTGDIEHEDHDNGRPGPGDTKLPGSPAVGPGQ